MSDNSDDTEEALLKKAEEMLSELRAWEDRLESKIKSAKRQGAPLTSLADTIHDAWDVSVVLQQEFKAASEEFKIESRLYAPGRVGNLIQRLTRHKKDLEHLTTMVQASVEEHWFHVKEEERYRRMTHELLNPLPLSISCRIRSHNALRRADANAEPDPKKEAELMVPILADNIQLVRNLTSDVTKTMKKRVSYSPSWVDLKDQQSTLENMSERLKNCQSALINGNGRNVNIPLLLRDALAVQDRCLELIAKLELDEKSCGRASSVWDVGKEYLQNAVSPSESSEWMPEWLGTISNWINGEDTPAVSAADDEPGVALQNWSQPRS